MDTIKSIDTVYKGYRFRSRLEARWAVYFDCMGIAYDYEPEGVEFENGVKYLPDFYLRDINTYVEIKPKGALKIKYDKNNSCVYINDGREKSDKYIAAIKNITKHHTYMLLMGDPVDVLTVNKDAEDEGGYFWNFNGICKLKAYDKLLNLGGGDIVCECAGKRIELKQCENKHPAMLFFVGFWKHKLVAVSSIDDDVCVIDESFVRIVTSKYGLFVDDILVINDFVNENMIQALRARQSRFEHGGTNIPTIADVSKKYRSLHDPKIARSCNDIEENIIGLLCKHPEYALIELEEGELSPLDFTNCIAMKLWDVIKSMTQNGTPIDEIYKKLHIRGESWKEAEEYIDFCEGKREGLSTNDNPNTYIEYVYRLRETKKKIDKLGA